MKILPGLEFLNGMPFDHEALIEDSNEINNDNVIEEEDEATD